MIFIFFFLFWKMSGARRRQGVKEPRVRMAAGSTVSRRLAARLRASVSLRETGRKSISFKTLLGLGDFPVRKPHVKWSAHWLASDATEVNMSRRQEKGINKNNRRILCVSGADTERLLDRD